MPRGERVLLDTHALLWWKAGAGLLSDTAAATIAEVQVVLVSPITCWEIGMLVGKGRVGLDRPVHEWVADLMSEDGVCEATLTPAVAIAAAQLPDLHGDPADRLIVASALAQRVPLLTKDRLLHAYAETSDAFAVIW
jgi:PIN domain nuclease of toxin-antitoxin system